MRIRYCSSDVCSSDLDPGSMRIAEEFPCRFTETEDCWIPLPDGVRLAAKLWLPEGAHEKPVPTILEVLPYRKHDQSAPREAQEIGRASGRERVCQTVKISVGAGTYKKQRHRQQ